MVITVKGILIGGVVHFPGETTGWAIRLDDEIEFHGQRLSTVEVDHDTSRFRPLENKFVVATGELRLWQGIERQFWPVLEVETIREVS
jgi:hypothetical protein